MFPKIKPSKIVRLPFEKGLNPRSGESVYITTNSSGIATATTKYPNEGRVKNVLFSLGLFRRKPCLRFGFIADASSYQLDGTCLVETIWD